MDTFIEAWIPSAVALMGGVVYGVFVGIVPGIGTTVGLLFLLPLVSYVPDPYVAVIFIVATTAAVPTGDTFASILLGIPGTGSSQATVLDGYPLSQRGRAEFALSAAFTSSTLSGLVWGALVFSLIPVWRMLLLQFGAPEMAALSLLGLSSVALLTSRHWGRGILAAAFGLWLGAIGYDDMGASRFTFGWDHLYDGVQIVAVAAGLFAIPEVVSAFMTRYRISNVELVGAQTREGIAAALGSWKLVLKGGGIGAGIGMLPGLGGAVVDWLAYAMTLRSNPGERFGTGNIKGVIGVEGANNACAAGAYIPTVIFGVPGSNSSVIAIALFIMVGFDVGTFEFASDERFLWAMSLSFLAATIAVGLFCVLLSKPISYITRIPYRYMFPPIIAAIVWASIQYTFWWQDLAILLAMTSVGFLAKHFNRHSPNSLRVCGNHNTVPPSRERNCIRRLPMT